MSRQPNRDWPRGLLDRAGRIRLAIFDIDGVMTDGRLYFSDGGEQIKAFHSRDGLGLKALMAHGIEVAVLTARRSRLAELRMAELGIARLLQGCDDKAQGLARLTADTGAAPEQTTYMGDDLVDWPAMRQCGLKLAPADAHPTIRERADFVAALPGGRGAVREACELLLAGRGALDDWIASFG